MRIQGSIDFTLVERTQLGVVAEMPVTVGIKNHFEVVHASAMLWFADVAATALVLGPENPTEDMKGFPLAIRLSANFLANQPDGALKTISTFVKKGKKRQRGSH